MLQTSFSEPAIQQGGMGSGGGGADGWSKSMAREREDERQYGYGYGQGQGQEQEQEQEHGRQEGTSGAGNTPTNEHKPLQKKRSLVTFAAQPEPTTLRPSLVRRLSNGGSEAGMGMGMGMGMSMGSFRSRAGSWASTGGQTDRPRNATLGSLGSW